MKKTSIFKPLIIGSLVTLLQFSVSPEASAFGGPVGGPFTNGTYFPNDGTFTAVVRGENLSGTVQFSTSSSAASTGVASIYYDGYSLTGNSQGAFNPSDSSMSVSFQAGSLGQGEQTIQVQKPVTTEITTLVQDPVTGVVTPVQTKQTTFQVTQEILYYDSLMISGSANCKTSNAFPNQKFKGDGEAEFQQLIFNNTATGGDAPFLDAVTMNISVSGVRLSNNAATFATSDLRRPSVNQFSLLVQ